MTRIYFHDLSPVKSNGDDLSDIEASITLVLDGIMAEKGKPVKSGLHLQFSRPSPEIYTFTLKDLEHQCLKSQFQIETVPELIGKEVTLYFHHQHPYPVVGFSKKL